MVTDKAEEWDPFYQNPLWRPKFNGRSKILRLEDYKRRPKVGHTATFENFEDAMVTLSWLTHKEQKKIYEQYKNSLKIGWNKNRVTSHEHVIRQLAQRFKLLPERVAAIVQLQFNEEKYRIDGTTEVLDDAGDYMDNAILNEIRSFYKAYNVQEPPDLGTFITEDIPCDGLPETKAMGEIDDIFDFDEEWKKFTDKALPEKAKKILDSHQFLQDWDDDKVQTPLDKETLSFIDRQKRMSSKMKSFETDDTPEAIKQIDEDNPDRRRRWKFVAQLVNTNTLKQKKKEAKEKPLLGWRQPKIRQLLPTSYSNNSLENTLVEQDGEIRPATLKDVKGTAWKPMRHDLVKFNTLKESTGVLEFIYREAKEDWLNFIQGRPHSGVFDPNRKTTDNATDKTLPKQNNTAANPPSS